MDMLQLKFLALLLEISNFLIFFKKVVLSKGKKKGKRKKERKGVVLDYANLVFTGKLLKVACIFIRGTK